METARIAACLFLFMDSFMSTLAEPALGEIVQVLNLPKKIDQATTSEFKVEDKRAALLLDKIMFAVQKALDEKEKSGKKSHIGGTGGVGGPTSGAQLDMASFTGSGLERRGNSHDRVYW